MFCCVKTIKLAIPRPSWIPPPASFSMFCCLRCPAMWLPGIKHNATASVCLSKWAASPWLRSCLGRGVHWWFPARHGRTELSLDGLFHGKFHQAKWMMMTGGTPMYNHWHLFFLKHLLIYLYVWGSLEMGDGSKSINGQQKHQSCSIHEMCQRKPWKTPVNFKKRKQRTSATNKMHCPPIIKHAQTWLAGFFPYLVRCFSQLKASIHDYFCGDFAWFSQL